jgi:hypothetical protein
VQRAIQNPVNALHIFAFFFNFIILLSFPPNFPIPNQSHHPRCITSRRAPTEPSIKMILSNTLITHTHNAQHTTQHKKPRIHPSAPQPTTRTKDHPCTYSVHPSMRTSPPSSLSMHASKRKTSTKLIIQQRQFCSLPP